MLHFHVLLSFKTGNNRCLKFSVWKKPTLNRK